MVDATRRKLHIPNWFSPYLEKHRIYELFHELGRELVIQKPADHVLFLKEVLYNASYSRFAPRIVLLAPPHVNTHDVAKLLAEKCKATVVPEKDILAFSPEVTFHRPKVKVLTTYLCEALRSNNVYYTGWILPDYPKTRKEAKMMQQVGILPTHVFQLIPPFAPNLYDLRFEKESEMWEKYRRGILGILDAFKHQLKEVYINDRTLNEVVDSCMELLNIKKRYKAPVIPRVCLLGPRGSGRNTQANMLENKFNLIHVNFQRLLCREWISETHLGSLLRACRHKVGHNSLLLTAVIHKRVLQLDCLERGWVLTGFPNTLEDAKNLDMIDTPPNRVIFLECELNQCRERIIHRKVDIYTGSIVHVLENPGRALNPNLETHPKDEERLVDSELNYYCEHYNALRKYCGQTANIVDGNQPIPWVSETILAILMRPLPESIPRCPDESTLNLTERSVDAASSQEDYCACPPDYVYPGTNI